MHKEAADLRRRLGVDAKKVDYSGTYHPDGNLNLSGTLGGASASEYSSVSKTMAAPGGIGVSALGQSLQGQKEENKDFGANRDTSNEQPVRGTKQSPSKHSPNKQSSGKQKSPYMSATAGGQSAERARKHDQDSYEHRIDDLHHKIGKSNFYFSPVRSRGHP